MHLYEERGPALRRSTCGACSRSRSGTSSSSGSCSRATASGSSRSTTASTTGCSRSPLELKALLRQPELSRDIDLDALEAYLAFNSIPAPLTIFREARKLPPGHLLIVERRRGDGYAATRGRARSRPASERPESEQELAVELRERLRDSVRAHLVADVPVGVLLSGGIDSSALAALAARESS